MKGILRFIRTTVLGGIMFLIPIIVLVIVIGKALKITGSLIAPFAGRIPVESVGGVASAKLLAILAIVLFCFLAGLFAKTRYARAIIRKIEDAVLSNLPGYSFVKGIGEGATGVAGERSQQPVLARFDDGWQFGFLMERLEGRYMAIFIPDAPNPFAGSVFFMTEDRIKRLEVPAMAAIKCLRRLGMGASELVKEALRTDEVR